MVPSYSLSKQIDKLSQEQNKDVFGSTCVEKEDVFFNGLFWKENGRAYRTRRKNYEKEKICFGTYVMCDDGRVIQWLWTKGC